MELTDLLQQTLHLSPTKARQVTDLFREDRLKKGDYSLKRGQTIRKLSFLREGHLRAWAPTEEKDITQWIFTPNYPVVDLNTLFFGVPARCNIQAISDCALWTLSEENYLRMNEVIPNWVAH